MNSTTLELTKSKKNNKAKIFSQSWGLIFSRRIVLIAIENFAKLVESRNPYITNLNTKKDKIIREIIKSRNTWPIGFLNKLEQ